MKTRLQTILCALAFALLMLAQSASAFYDASLGRWINRDPIQEEGGVNLYQFVGNDSINWVDSDGRLAAYFHQMQRRVAPKGFARCQRNVACDGASDCAAVAANAAGGQHVYVQHVDDDGSKWGWGFSGGNRTSGEKHFDPSSCKPCKRTDDPLKFGTGAGKAGNQATDAEIKDCLKNRPPSRPYSFPTYVCSDWAKEAEKDCGLNCN